MLTIGAKLLGLVGLRDRWTGTQGAVAQVIALVVAVALLLMVVRLLWGAFDYFNDRDAVERATNEANAEFNERQVEVEREVGADKAARDKADAAAQDDLQEEVDEADRNGDSAADSVWNGGLFDDSED